VLKHPALAAFALSAAGIIGVYAAATRSVVAPPPAPPLTREEVAKLEPEICKASWSRAITGALPVLVGSSTADMTPVQIALVDQYKPEGRHKVWVIRIPAAFVNYRTCDLGRENWIGTGDYVKISQHERLALIILGGEVVPASRASKKELESGIKIDVYLHNTLRAPRLRHQAYAGRLDVIGHVIRPDFSSGGPLCRDVPSEIPGLVTFKRIDLNIRDRSDCEGAQKNGVFARKLDNLVYDFIAACSVNCTVRRDYHGWDVTYSYAYVRLAEWQRIHELLETFF
jgi:hypothetical protein